MDGAEKRAGESLFWHAVSPYRVIRAVRDLRAILGSIETIAIVGLSAAPTRPSAEVCAFLVARGYRCTGVNPMLAGRTIHGVPVVAALGDLPKPIDMIDIFRRSSEVGGIVDEALALRPRPRLIWMQIGVIDPFAEARAEASGVTVVMNACPKIVLSSSS